MQALLSKQNVKLIAMADAFRDNLDTCYKELMSDDIAESSGGRGTVKAKIDVPEERKFTGFDGYEKAIALAQWAERSNSVKRSILRPVSAPCCLMLPLPK